MKIIKRIIILMLFVSCFFLIPVHAEKGYLEAKDYISLEANDVTSKINNFLNTCKTQNKNAYFNKGIYKINGTVSLRNGVSILGEEGAIIQGTDSTYQSHFQDNVESVLDISIEHLVFDNVTLYFKGSKSTNIVLKNNIFLNARKVDTSISTGLQPDSNNKNGGESTGYYISKNYNKIDILSNLFIRDKNSLGRGIGIYKTKDVVIEDNYFGLLEDIESSIVSLETKNLKQLVLSLNLIDETSDQGYFMTGINVINSDVNVKILKNHFSFNKNITEAGYEDGSQSTSGYNRDHLIYAKMYDGLDIVGNYFKGMNKNQDGAVKCRNGENLFIYKNIFEDSLILLYVQKAAEKLYLKNVCIEENIFINKDYEYKLIEIPSGTTSLKKYITIDYLILIKNYDESAVVNNITITSNHILSDSLANEQIRIDNTNFHLPTNITIKDNKNHLDKLARLTIINTYGQANYDSNQGQSPNYTNGTSYEPVIQEEYKTFSIKDKAKLKEVNFEIKDKRIITDASLVYVDGVRYSGEVLSNGAHQLFLIKNTTTDILVETDLHTISSREYTNCEIIIEDTVTLSYNTNGHGKENWAEEVVKIPLSLPVLFEKGYTFLGWYLDENFTKEAVGGSLLNKNTTLYAKWEKETYTITYDTKGHGQILPTEHVTALPNPLPTLTAEGYTFLGWYMDSDYKTLAQAGQEITNNVILFAKWETITYTISFELNGHGERIGDMEGVITIPTLPTPVEEGYRFVGWYLDSNFTNQAIVGNQIDRNITLYAKWEKEPDRITVFFNSKGGSAVVSITNIESGSKINKPTDPTREGYRFVGWFKDTGGELTEEFNFETEVITESITLYAKWEKIKYFKVSYYILEEGLLKEELVKEKDKALAPTVSPKDGWTFKGWYIDEDCSIAWDFNHEIQRDIQLYGLWILNLKGYTIHFEMNGHGGKIENKTEALALPNPLPMPKEDGWTFEGWYEDDGCSILAKPGSELNRHITLYAKWSKIIKKYNVLFYIEDYGSLIGIKVEEFKKISRPDDPVVDGYIFYGWYEDDTYTTKFDFEKDAITKDTTLYGKWIAIPKESQGVHPFVIIGPVIGGILSIGLVVGGVFFFRKRKK